MRWFWWALAGCKPAPDRVDTGEPPAPCVAQGEEVPLDGIDQDCDGWGDEQGEIGVGAAASADRVLVGEKYFALGMSVAVGLDATGAPQLAIGPTTFGWGSEVWLDAGPVDGVPETRVPTPPYDSRAEEVAVIGYSTPLVYTGGFPKHGEYFLDASFYSSGRVLEDVGVADVELDTVGSTPNDLAVADVDLDGTDDLITGMGGELQLFIGPPPGARWTASDLMIRHPTDNFAYTIGEAGDLTGDGLPELTAYGENDATGGRVWILPGDLRGEFLAVDVGWWIEGLEPEAQLGFEVALGDANADGYQDVLSGAFLADARAGRSYLVHGPLSETTSLAVAAADFGALSGNDWCGYEVAMLDDADGDGTDEILVGCPRDSFGAGGLPGRVDLYRGSDAEGTLDPSQAARVWVGESPADAFGVAIADGVDLTGDGQPDLAIGAPFEDLGGENAGAVWIIAGPVL